MKISLSMTVFQQVNYRQAPHTLISLVEINMAERKCLKGCSVLPDRKVKITIEYATTTLPANSNSGYYISAIAINEEYL